MAFEGSHEAGGNVLECVVAERRVEDFRMVLAGEPERAVAEELAAVSAVRGGVVVPVVGWGLSAAVVARFQAEMSAARQPALGDLGNSAERGTDLSSLAAKSAAAFGVSRGSQTGRSCRWSRSVGTPPS